MCYVFVCWHVCMCACCLCMDVYYVHWFQNLISVSSISVCARNREKKNQGGCVRSDITVSMRHRCHPCSHRAKFNEYAGTICTAQTQSWRKTSYPHNCGNWMKQTRISRLPALSLSYSQHLATISNMLPNKYTVKMLWPRCRHSFCWRHLI